TIDPRPYEIRLAQAHAQLETANARLVLAGRELHRAEVLADKAFGTEQTVDQRTADQRTGQAAVDDAKAQLRDPEFDLEHCRITAPFTGRVDPSPRIWQPNRVRAKSVPTGGHREANPCSRCQPYGKRAMIAPSGEQIEIAVGDQQAVVVEVGGGLRS